jgi:hypothetical protein
MGPIDTFTLSRLPRRFPFLKPETRYRLDHMNMPTALALRGDTIHHQFGYAGGYLVITHQDHFEGVRYWFCLIDPDLKRRHVVSTPEYFGFLQDLEHPAPHRLEFGFYGTSDRWRLDIGVDVEQREEGAVVDGKRTNQKSWRRARLVVKKIDAEIRRQ